MPAGSPLHALPETHSDLARVEAALRASVDTTDPQLTEIASHLILAGGKRLRPVLAVVSARTAERDADDDVVLGGVACAVETCGRYEEPGQR